MRDEGGVDIEDVADDDEPANKKIVVKPRAAAKPPVPAPPKPAEHRATAHEPAAAGTMPATAAQPSHH
jgi:hypothetical protein